MKIDIDQTELEQLPGQIEHYTVKFRENVEIAMSKIAELIRDKLEEITPKQTGFTAESWTVIPVGTMEFVIINSNEPIATFLSQGTAPHDIYGSPLHWIDINSEGKTADRFAMHVRHPGTRALYLEDTAMLAIEPLIDDFINAADDAAWSEAFNQ